MKILSLKFLKTQKLNPSIIIDGKAVKLKRNSFGNYEIKHQTEKDKVEVVIHRYLEFSSPLWLFWSLLYFVISIFGIFDYRLDLKCVVINCRFIVPLDDNEENVVLVNLNDIKSEKAVTLQYKHKLDIIANNYFVDDKVRKRTKIILILRIAIFSLLVVFIGFLLFKKYL